MQGNPQKDKDDPICLSVGTQVSAKYKGAFCEAKVKSVIKNIKVKVAYKKGGSANVSDDQIVGEIRVGNGVEFKDTDKKENIEATVIKIQDCSQYTVVFDDGDITTLRRSALCRQSGKHFNACDTLDQLPLTHPEHRGGKRSKAQDEWSDEDEEYAIGKVICVENTDTKKKNAKESWFPALVVAPKAQETAKIHVKTEYLVRSFKDGRYYTVPKKEATEFSNETSQKADTHAVAAAREYLDKNVLPNHWDRDVLIDSGSLSDQELSDSSDDEPNEVKDRFFAQLLEFMEKRNSPLNKGPSITNRDVDLYRLYYSVEKLGGYANVTKIRNWKAIAKRLGFTPTDAIVKLVKHSYRKFLLAFEEAVAKGIEDLPPRTERSGKARSSSTRSNSVASPKVTESTKSSKKSFFDKPCTSSSIADDSENTSESTKLSKPSRKLSNASGKVKAIVEKFEEKTKEMEKPPPKEEESGMSVSSVPSSLKKEKFKKKPPEIKKRKEEVELKKVDLTAASSKIAHSGPIIGEDILIDIDDRLKVYYRGSSDYEAKVLDITHQDGKPMYRVHYKGWNARYDEWINRESIAENLTKEEPKKKQSALSKSSTLSTPAGSSSSLQTPSGKGSAKRGRNRADTTTSSRSTTPLSNTSGKTKIVQKRITRTQPSGIEFRRASLNADNSSVKTDSEIESDEPIKKPSERDIKKGKDEKLGCIQKSSSSDLVTSDLKAREYDINQIRSDLNIMKDTKPNAKSHIRKEDDGGAKSDDDKFSMKSDKSPFDIKSKLKPLQRDSSRSSFHSTDSDSSHSVPSDVPNSSKSAYTSENESNGPEKISSTVIVPKTDDKKSSFRYDEDSSDIKNLAASSSLASFFDKTVDNAASGKFETASDSSVFVATTKKANIFHEKKLTQQRNLVAVVSGSDKAGRFGQLEKSSTKDSIKNKLKDTKTDDKPATESDIYEFKDTEEFPDAKTTSSAGSKKQESPGDERISKKQQLIQQRKQAKALQKEISEVPSNAPNPMEDIESLIKSSIVQSNKKRKKSPTKDQLPSQQPTVAAKMTLLASSGPLSIPTPGSGNQPSWGIQPVVEMKELYPSKVAQQSTSNAGPASRSTGKSESTFDVLRKSPSFNMQQHVSDDFPIAKPKASPAIKTPPGPSAPSVVKSLFSNVSESETQGIVKLIATSNEDEKPELETFKKMLDASFDILPKAEKTVSIADKLLKEINKKEYAITKQQETSVIKKEETPLKTEPFALHSENPSSSPVASVLSVGITSGNLKKPVLASPELKVDDSVKKNVELIETIQKLETALQRSTTPIGAMDAIGSPEMNAPFSAFASTKKQDEDFSDTDSDPRLVIEDETPAECDKKITKAPMGVLETIMMQGEVPYKQSNMSTVEAEKKSEPSGEQQNETMSLLLCEETIPGSPAPISARDPLSEVGRSPSSSGGFVHPPTMPSQSSTYNIKYPGSMTTALLHQQYQLSASHQTNLKQIPMDIDTDVSSSIPATGDILRDKLKSERGSATSSGNNTNNNSDNSPRDSNDDQSDGDKNAKPEATPKKRRRNIKEPDSSQKRRRLGRNANVRGNLQACNDSDSNDNSDVNAFNPRSQTAVIMATAVAGASSSHKMQFNFLVELDPNLSSNQRINILTRKIQELKKTYLMIKNEMNAKDRRRKKLRRRERENKKQAA